jgi:hypothetical protein
LNDLNLAGGEFIGCASARTWTGCSGNRGKLLIWRYDVAADACAECRAHGVRIISNGEQDDSLPSGSAEIGQQGKSWTI